MCQCLRPDPDSCIVIIRQRVLVLGDVLLYSGVVGAPGNYFQMAQKKSYLYGTCDFSIPTTAKREL